MITCQHCHGTRGEHVGFDCPEDPTRPPAPAALAVLPSPVCELCGVPFNPNVPPQTCAGQPCLVPENEIIDWVVRVRGSVPSESGCFGRWPSNEWTDALLADQALSLSRIVVELAGELGEQLTGEARTRGARGAQLVPQCGPYCPSYLRAVPPLELSVVELQLMQRAWHTRGWMMGKGSGAEDLDRVWSRVAKHLLEMVCARLQDEIG